LEDSASYTQKEAMPLRSWSLEKCAARSPVCTMSQMEVSAAFAFG
jgi:hypothetical protein